MNAPQDTSPVTTVSTTARPPAAPPRGARRSCAVAAVAAAAALLVGSAVAAPGASAGTAATAGTASTAATVDPAATYRGTRIIGYWYQSFLGRTLDQTVSDPGRSYWADRLDAGEAPVDVLDDLVHTREYAENQVQAYYSTYLGRDPDPGAEVWIRGMTGDVEEEWVVQNILASPEFVGRPEAPGFYVSTVFEAVLGRRPADGERGYWIDRYQRSGWDELSLVREVWYTPEAVDRRIEEHYAQRLGRVPSTAEVEYWRSSEVASDLSTTVAIAASDEGVTAALLASP